MKTKRIFNVMNVITWIVFIGYCIKAGSIVMVSLISLSGNKNATENLYLGMNLSTLYEFSMNHFILVAILLIAMASLSAYLFYLLIKIFRQLDLNQPFKARVIQLIFRMSTVALVIGIVGLVANSYIHWLRTQVFFTQLDIGNTSAYFFMAGVVFIIATLFKRAMDIQQENELTI